MKKIFLILPIVLVACVGNQKETYVEYNCGTEDKYFFAFGKEQLRWRIRTGNISSSMVPMDKIGNMEYQQKMVVMDTSENSPMAQNMRRQSNPNLAKIEAERKELNIKYPKADISHLKINSAEWSEAAAERQKAFEEILKKYPDPELTQEQRNILKAKQKEFDKIKPMTVKKNLDGIVTISGNSTITCNPVREK
ncbi:MAG: hypothetical protein FWG80_00495 [Alphaproteobacteria bacterium]|nr:hypothetical protein [Alphaproteobacteria bacterium]